jgi:hypothetical protein
VRRAHRLVREALRHRDNRLREHLGAFHHLPTVLAGPNVTAGVAGEPILPVGLHVKQIQQALHRPLRLLRFCGQIRSTSRASHSRLSVTL